MAETAVPINYQLRVVLRGISPLIWRRLLVRGDSTIADLHHTLQIAVGWTDAHLHRFVIRGKDYGIAHLGGLLFDDDPTRVRLADLGLRLGERFGYRYDFGDDWQHDLRVEQLVPIEPGKTYPVCIGGARATPPEDCGGPWAFLDLRQQYHPVLIAERLAAIHREMLDAADPDAVIDEYREELAELVRWAAIDRLDRRHLNRRLARCGRILRGGGEMGKALTRTGCIEGTGSRWRRGNLAGAPPAALTHRDAAPGETIGRIRCIERASEPTLGTHSGRIGGRAPAVTPRHGGTVYSLTTPRRQRGEGPCRQPSVHGGTRPTTGTSSACS